MNFLEKIKKRTKKAILPRKSGFIWSPRITKIVNAPHTKDTTKDLFWGNFLKLRKVLFFKRKIKMGLFGGQKAQKLKQQHIGVYDAKSIVSCFCLFLVLIFCKEFFAKTRFYGDYQRGYFWFETPRVFDPSEKETQTKKNETAWSDSKYKTAREALKAFKAELDEKKAQFVMKPTVDSALSFLKIQKAMLKQSSKASHVYGKALLLTEKGHTTSSYVVNRIKDDEQRLKNDQKLKLSSRYFDILFVYKKSCPYCEKFKDVLLRFQKTYGYQVDGLSIGGGSYKDFHHLTSHPIEKLTTFDMVPAVFLVSKAKDIAAPITQGYLPYDLLGERVVFILDEIEKGQ